MFPIPLETSGGFVNTRKLAAIDFDFRIGCGTDGVLNVARAEDVGSFEGFDVLFRQACDVAEYALIVGTDGLGTTKILNWQWQDVAIPYWRDLAAVAEGHGIERICIELHGAQLVYNTETMLKLREAAGELVGANYDPSHMMWMGGEPLAGVRRLGQAIFHVHAKDTRIDRANSDPNTLLETKTNDRVAERSWNYVTLGYGHGEQWWRDFVTLLAQVGYDDVLSIEHEDHAMSPLEGVRKSVELLQRVIIREVGAAGSA